MFSNYGDIKKHSILQGIKIIQATTYLNKNENTFYASTT